MDDDTSVRKLVELMFSIEFENSKGTTVTDSSIPTCSLTNDFPRILESVLFRKQFIFEYEWESYINKLFKIMFSSHTIYLKCVIFACLTERTYHENVFEMFISVCALLKFFNDNIRKKIGTDLRDLNIDAIMVLYDNFLKCNLCEEGGFQHLVEYIRGHRYRSWKWVNLASNDATSRAKILEEIKLEKELNRSGTHRTVEEIKTMETTSGILAQKVLSTTAVELPSLSNIPHKIEALKANISVENEKEIEIMRIMKAAKGFEDVDEHNEGCSSSNSDSIKDLKASGDEEKADESAAETTGKEATESVDLRNP